MKLWAGMRSAWLRFAPATKKDVERILMKVSEVAGFVTNVSGKIDVISTEVTKVAAEIQALKDSLENVDLPPEAEAALTNLSARSDALATAVKAADDIIPDNPTAPPTP